MKVKFFDLRVTDKSLRTQLNKNFNKLLTHGQFFLGPEVELIEKKISKFLGKKYAVGLDSGSSALYLCLKSMGIKPGDEVITTPLTWIITINAIAKLGAIPIFVDVKDDLNINEELIERKITSKTKAIVPMHYAGHMCNMEKINHIAKKHKLFIVEDAAQSFGASLNKKKSGHFSDACAFSMNPMKSLAGYGEAGIALTNNLKVYNKLKLLRHAGTTSDPKKIITNNCLEISLNHKMDSLNASMLLVAFKNFPKKMKKKQKFANLYYKFLSKGVITQKLLKNEIHGRYVFPIIVNKRNHLREYLSKNGIETKIFNAPLASEAPVYKKYNNKDTPNAKKMINKILILPCHENLTEKQVKYVINKINKYYD